MPLPSPRDPRAASAGPRPGRGVLIVGPGGRARDLAAVLGALGAPLGIETRAFDDLAELATESGRGGMLVLDADALPIEDVGFVRRFLAGNGDVEVVLVGSAPRAPSVRALGPRRFVLWPPDVEDLAALVASVRRPGVELAREPAAPRTPSARASAPAIVADDDELEQVRAILEQRPAAPPAHEVGRRAPAFEEGAPRARVPDVETPRSRVAVERAPEPRADEAVARRANGFAIDEEIAARAPQPAARGNNGSARVEDRADPLADRGRANPFDVDADLDDAAGTAVESAIESAVDPAAESTSATTDAEDAARSPRVSIGAPPWWRAQVADLADAAQRIDLSVKMLAQAAPEIDEGELEEARARLREVEGEVARLVQFTRTLGYVAAPPPAGSQTFDLGEIVHLFASGLAQSGPEAPRCQFKSAPDVGVRSDRQLLSQALDALFFLVRCTSRQGDLVRARVQRVDADGRTWVELELDFPSGPLEGLVEDDILSPYSLADLFPELGPNALAAAAGIVAGQGGTLALHNRKVGRMTWRLRMPPAGA